MNNADIMCKLFFKFNIISFILLALSVLACIFFKIINALNFVLLSYFIFQLPLLILSCIILFPIIHKYKIYFITRYYDMGENVRRNWYDRYLNEKIGITIDKLINPNNERKMKKQKTITARQYFEKESPSDSDSIELLIGMGLLPLVEKEKGAELLEAIRIMRRQISQDTGIMIPKIRIKDSVHLEFMEYCIKINDVVSERRIFNKDDPPSVIIECLTEVIKRNVGEFNRNTDD